MENYNISVKDNRISECVYDDKKITMHFTNVNDENDNSVLRIGFNSAACTMLNKHQDVIVVNRRGVVNTVSIDDTIFAIKYNDQIIPITDLYHEDTKSFELDGVMKEFYEKFANRNYYVTRDHLIEVASAAIDYNESQKQNLSLK